MKNASVFLSLFAGALGALAVPPVTTAQQDRPDDRLARIRNLMQTSPGEAARLVLPSEWGDWEGRLVTEIHDDFERGRTFESYYLRTAESLLRLRLAAPLAAVDCSSAVKVSGYRAGQELLVQAVERGPAPRDGIACSVGGVQKTVVILASLPSMQLPAAVNATFLQTAFTGPGRSVNGYYQEASAGRTSLAVTVAGPFTLGADYDCANTRELVNAAIQVADASVDFQQYNRIVVVAPRKTACAIGVGSLGCTTLSSSGDGSFPASYLYLASDYLTSNDATVSVAAHEFGHNLGLGHSNSRDYGNVTLGPVGTPATDSEYRDIYSMMGLSFSSGGQFVLGHFAPQHKVQLGWLTPGTEYQDVESSGTFTLVPYSSTGAGLKALRVRRGAGINEWLWIEAREQAGYTIPR